MITLVCFNPRSGFSFRIAERIEFRRQVKNSGFGSVALFKSGRVHERFEGRAGLAARQRHVHLRIKPAVFPRIAAVRPGLGKIIARADHCQNLPGFRVGRHEPGVGGVKFFLVFLGEFFYELFGFGLPIPVEGGQNRKPASFHRVLSVFFNEILFDVERKMRGANALQRPVQKFNSCFVRRLVFFLGNESQLFHFFQHQSLSRFQLLAVRAVGRKARRCFGKRRQISGFGQS